MFGVIVERGVSYVLRRERSLRLRSFQREDTSIVSVVRACVASTPRAVDYGTRADSAVGSKGRRETATDAFWRTLSRNAVVNISELNAAPHFTDFVLLSTICAIVCCVCQTGQSGCEYRYVTD